MLHLFDVELTIKMTDSRLEVLAGSRYIQDK